jgi:hypothetical protein
VTVSVVAIASSQRREMLQNDVGATPVYCVVLVCNINCKIRLAIAVHVTLNDGTGRVLHHA